MMAGCRSALAAVFLFFFMFVFADDMGPFPEAEFAPKLTNEFVVQVAPGTHLGLLERLHNVTFKRSLITRENFHVFTIPHLHHDPKFHLSPEVLWFERQSRNKRFKKDYFTDPQYHNQWHLHDTTHGNDLGVEGAWAMGYTGAGVLISVVDDGLNYYHEDIRDAYYAEASYDVAENDDDPMPSSWDVHGSEVGGTVGARSDNGVCGSGVAPGSTIAAIRLLAGDPADYEEAEALQYRGDIVDIYTNSWGPYDDAQRLEGPGPLVMAAFEAGTRLGRGGKGSIFTWAAGNGKGSNDNCNYDGFSNSRYTIAVGASARNGQEAYYSEPCSAMVVCAPSSDSSNMITTSSKDSDCKSNFGGTSAACPMVAGVVALCLEANPELGWRDVQGVLISSATQTNRADTDWKVNGAGYLINHKFGYGRVNATAAVIAALEWQNYPEEILLESGVLIVNTPIPDRGLGEIVLKWECTEDVKVEHVEIFFDAQHAKRGQLIVVLTSPMGTDSILAEVHGDRNSDYDLWKFMTVRSWGENSLGTWTLTVTDGTSGIVGNMDFWDIKVFGHEEIREPESSSDDMLPSFSSFFSY